MAISTVSKVSVTGRILNLDYDQPLLGQTAVNDGVWIEAWFYKYLSYMCRTFNAGDIVQIRGSNEATVPANTAHGVQIGSDVTSDQIITVTNPPRWVKIRKSAAAATPAATDAFFAAVWEM